MSGSRIAAIVLAAGKGTRLKSERPKVLHEVCGRPMLAYPIDACFEAGVQTVICVVGHEKEQVIAALRGDPRIVFVEQNPQNGTGHAVMVCREAFGRQFDHVLVVGGDGPLLRATTLRQLIDKHLAGSYAATLATAIIDDPTGYGRIVRDAAGSLRGIVEQGECTPEQRQIREVNPSYYCFRVPELLTALEQIRPNNKKGEYYLTDALAILIGAGHACAAVSSVLPEDVFSINTRRELAFVNDVLRRRILNEHMDAGVTIIDPANTWIDARARIGNDTVVYPFVVIDGPATIGRGCRVGPFVRLSGEALVEDGRALAGATAEAAR